MLPEILPRSMMIPSWPTFQNGDCVSRWRANGAFDVARY